MNESENRLNARGEGYPSLAKTTFSRADSVRLSNYGLAIYGPQATWGRALSRALKRFRWAPCKTLQRYSLVCTVWPSGALSVPVQVCEKLEQNWKALISYLPSPHPLPTLLLLVWSYFYYMNKLNYYWRWRVKGWTPVLPIVKKNFLLFLLTIKK